MNRHQQRVDQQYQFPTGHQGVCQVFDGLDHLYQLERKEQES